ncbi:MAG: ParB/RepB/Spo0J family partition protein [Acidiphilium sp.]|nr:ParB/RepB/Spo0J family partition protein [Acidiphilium sp.]
MTTATTITSVPLSKLVPSPRNVRKTGREVGIDALAADILTEGLLQNLVVTESKGGKYAVEAGGRRLAALKKLAKEKRIPASFPVPVKIVQDDDALAASLAENIMQAPMHPADQFEAFSTLIANGRSIEDVAAQFGVTPAVVTRRLKLANVAPEIVTAFRADRLTLDQVMGFTVSNDHAEQMTVYEEICRSPYRSDRNQIITRLTNEKVRTSDRRFQFIGEEAYTSAGGTITRDLFDQDGAGYADDTKLLDRLTMERLEARTAEILARGWKWIEAVPVITYDLRNGFSRINTRTYPISEERADRLSDLATQYDELTETGDEDALTDEERARLETITAEMDEIEAERNHYDPAEMALAGGWIGLDFHGEIALELGYVRKEDAAALAQLRDSGKQADDEDTSPDGNDAITQAPKGAKIPETVLADLHAARTAALRVELADRPDIALKAVAFTLASRLILHAGSALTIHATSPVLPDSARATVEPLSHRIGHWTLRLPGEAAKLWPAIMALSDSDTLDLIAVCAASTLDALHTKPDLYNARQQEQHRAQVDQIAATLSLDMGRHWTVNIDNYLGRIGKDAIIDAVKDAKGKEATDRLASMKKADMAAAAAELLDGTGWLPAPLRARA